MKNLRDQIEPGTCRLRSRETVSLHLMSGNKSSTIAKDRDKEKET
jgi:hypothetical protein